MVTNLDTPRVAKLLAGEFKNLCIAGLGASASCMGVRGARDLTAGRGVPQLVRASARTYAHSAERIGVARVQYHRILDTLDAFDTWENGKYARSYIQKQLHKIYLNACLDIIFRASWNRDQAMAMAEAGVTKIEKKVAVAMARRFGKSFSLGYCLAAILVGMVESGVSIIVYSSCLRASVGLLSIVKMFINQIEGIGKQIVVDNQENLVLQLGDNSARRNLVSLPCPADVCTLSISSSPIWGGGGGEASSRHHTQSRSNGQTVPSYAKLSIFLIFTLPPS